MTEYKYGLDKSSKKSKCPSCQKKTLVRYVDNESGNYMSDDIGRCDRENSCAYHKNPKGSASSAYVSSTKAPPQVVPTIIIYPNGQSSPGFGDIASPFHIYCRSLGITNEFLKTMRIGTKGNRTIFGIHDKNRLLNIKYIPYQENGSRKRGKSDFPYYLKAQKENERYERCLYGLHIYDPSLKTVIVESEKSAVLGKFFYPACNWLATGGSNGIKANHLDFLLGGKNEIIYLSDNDKAGENNKVIRHLKTIGGINGRVTVSNPFKSNTDGYDIADWIRDNREDITGIIGDDLDISQDILVHDAVETKPIFVFDEYKCAEAFPFVYVDEKTNTRTGEIKTSIGISEPEFSDWLHNDLGFSLYKYGDSYIYIQIESVFVRGTDRQTIKGIVDKTTKKYPTVREAIRKNRNLLSAEALEFLPNMTSSVKPRIDLKDSCIMYYKNAAVRVSKNGSELIQYSDIGWYVWEEEVLDRDISFPLPDIDPEFSFFQYTNLVSGCCKQRQASLMVGMAYMIHSYKNQANSKVFFITDEMARPDEPNGGSGKGIVGQALSHMVPYVKENAISMRMDQFMYQQCKPNTRVFCFDEVTNTFPFRKLFSDITDGITIEKKGIGAETISAQDSPKFLMLSNDRIKMDGGSYKRRIYKVELSGHFNENHTPMDEFGELLFSDWDDKKWLQFDTFMISCLHTYFCNDCELITIENINSKLIQLEYNTNPDFVNFADFWEKNTEYNKTNEQNKFMNQNNMTKLSGRKWTSWIKRYCEYKGTEFTERAGTQNQFKIFSMCRGDSPMNKYKQETF